METFKISVDKISNIDYNPRIIDTYKYETLKKSILELPEMLIIRPIIIDDNNNIIAGNMRYRACIELEYKEVWVKQIHNLTEDQKKELIIKDNLSYGEWDEQVISDKFNITLVNDWLGNQIIDYSALLYEDVTDKLDNMESNIKKAFHIKINGDYQKAKDLEKRFKERNIYIGALLIDKLKEVKQAYENS
jgi:hypothetical protein